MTPADALFGYAVAIPREVRDEAGHLNLVAHDEGGHDARQGNLLLGDAATHHEGLPADLLWAIFERQLARVGQPLARHAPDSELASAVRELAKAAAASRADAPLRGIEGAGYLTAAQRDRLVMTSRPLAEAWYCGHPPLKAWTDVEELARLARVEARLRELEVPAGAQAAREAGYELAKRAADEAAGRLGQWLDKLTDQDWKSGAALDPARYPASEGPRGVGSYGFWLLMLAESLADPDAVAVTDQLAQSVVVEAHRRLVTEHTGERPDTPVVALAAGPWLNAAADEGLSSRAVKGNCWRGYAMFLPSETAQRLVQEQGRFDGELLHEMVEDIQGDRDEHPYKEPIPDGVADYLREGATEAVTQLVLQRAGQPPGDDEQVGYPSNTFVAEEVARHLDGDEPLRPLLAMLATDNVLAWLVERCRSCTDSEKQLVGAIEDTKNGLGGAFGLGFGGPMTRAKYEASRPAYDAMFGDLRAVLQNCCK
jgi:hypothetical protein